MDYIIAGFITKKSGYIFTFSQPNVLDDDYTKIVDQVLSSVSLKKETEQESDDQQTE
jgi:hypothetical protein